MDADDLARPGISKDRKMSHINGLVQDWGKSLANALELP